MTLRQQAIYAIVYRKASTLGAGDYVRFAATRHALELHERGHSAARCVREGCTLAARMTG